MLGQKRLHIISSPFCNNNCLFCLANISKINVASSVCEENTERDLLKMKGKLDKVVFSGGEPTLSKKCVYFIKLAKKLGYKEIALTTNGRRFANKDFCLEVLGSGLTEINLSIHGSNKQVQEAVTRSPGSFEETFSGVCNLSFLKRKYQFRFNINFTVTKLNYKDLYNFLRLIISFKAVDDIVLNVVIPKGRAEDFFAKIVPSYQKVGKELKKVIPCLKKDLGISKKLPISIIGLPPCLLSGIEEYIGFFETIVIRRNFLDKNKTIVKSSPWGSRIKGLRCKKCKYDLSCAGVWASYIKRMGWKEFKPV